MQPTWQTEDGRVKLYRGDCLEVMPGLEKVDMIFTDPPFGHNNNNGDLISRWEAALGRGEYNPAVNDRPICNDGKEAEEIFEQFIIQAKNILREQGCCCCCCGGGGPDPMFARWSLILDRELTFKQMIIWDKGPMGMGWHYRRSYETVLVAHKGNSCKWYDNTQRIENIIRPGYAGIRKIIPSASQHPTVKPTELSTHFIKLHSLSEDIIFDPFMGSGSTGVSAVQESRRFIGIEIDEKYFEIAVRRIQDALKEKRNELPFMKEVQGEIYE